MVSFSVAFSSHHTIWFVGRHYFLILPMEQGVAKREALLFVKDFRRISLFSKYVGNGLVIVAVLLSQFSKYLEKRCCKTLIFCCV